MLDKNVKPRQNANKPIELHPENRHYFLYHGRPEVLVTSAEHYGALVNGGFDYQKYLDILSDLGLNHTRIFLGDYLEKPGDFGLPVTPIAPKPEHIITPWQRSDSPGYCLGGNKFDLEKWDDMFFSRLHGLMQLAQEKGIVVEAVFFYVAYLWPQCVMHTNNNINKTTPIRDVQYMTMDNGNILMHQQRYVRKIVHECNPYDNIIFNIANEPWFINPDRQWFVAGPSLDTKKWIEAAAGWIVDEEKKLPNNHLISVDYCNEGLPIPDQDLNTFFRNISVFNHHYDRTARSLKANYGLNRALAFNETGLMPPVTPEYRIQGWRYMLSGGALYNNLDFTYQCGFEDGSFDMEFPKPHYTGCADKSMKNQMKILLDFMRSTDLLHMKPSPETIKVYFGHQDISCMAWEGRQYILYIAGGSCSMLKLNIKTGCYNTDWIDPKTGRIIKSETIEVVDDCLELMEPEYDEDIALKIIRK